MALMPKQTKAETKLMWGLTFNRFIGIVMTMMISMFFSEICATKLKIPFMIICVATYLVLNIKAPTNPKKPYYQGIGSFLLYLYRPKKYFSVNSAEYEKTIERERELNELKIQAAQRAESEKDERKRAAQTAYIIKILNSERRARFKERARIARDAERLARKEKKAAKKR